MVSFHNDDESILQENMSYSSSLPKTGSAFFFELYIRRGNHGPLNRTTRSVYQFSVEYQDLTLEYLRRIIRVKVEEAINDADKANADYKFYDIHRVQILSNMKKPMKDNPFLDSFTDTTLRNVCSSIRQRRKSQAIPLVISASAIPLEKRPAAIEDTHKIDSSVNDAPIVGIPFDNTIPVNIDSSSTLHTIPYVSQPNSVQPSLPITVFPDAEYVPIRAKIQTNEVSFNGTIMLNREDLFRAFSNTNFQQYSMQEHSWHVYLIKHSYN